MIIGAVFAAAAVTLAITAVRGASHVERRIDRMTRVPHVSIERVRDDGVGLRLACGLAGTALGCAIAWSSGGFVALPIATGAGWVTGAIAVDRRSAARRAESERAMVTVAEWLYALVASGRPVEAAVTALAGSGMTALDGALARVRRDYTLGVPLHDAIARVGAATGIRGLVDLGDRLRRARTLGRGALPMLQDLRDQLRADERARALEAASHVEGKLTLVLTLFYLPALALLVIVPLFLALLAGLFG